MRSTLKGYIKGEREKTLSLPSEANSLETQLKDPESPLNRLIAYTAAKNAALEEQVSEVMAILAKEKSQERDNFLQAEKSEQLWRIGEELKTSQQTQQQETERKAVIKQMEELSRNELQEKLTSLYSTKDALTQTIETLQTSLDKLTSKQDDMVAQWASFQEKNTAYVIQNAQLVSASGKIVDLSDKADVLTSPSPIEVLKVNPKLAEDLKDEKSFIEKAQHMVTQTNIGQHLKLITLAARDGIDSIEISSKQILETIKIQKAHLGDAIKHGNSEAFNHVKQALATFATKLNLEDKLKNAKSDLNSVETQCSSIEKKIHAAVKPHK